MKVTSATVRLVLRTNKTLSDGTHPIVVRVQYNGRKEKSTGYSCLPKQWDERNECLRKNAPNSAMINQNLWKMKDAVVQRKLEYENDGTEYTAQMLFEERRKVVDKSFISILNAMAKERGLKKSTMKTYLQVYKQLKRYMGHEFDIIEIDDKAVRGYVQERLRKGISKGTLRLYMQVFYSIWHYAYKEGIVSYDMSDRYEYWDELPIAKNKRALSLDDISYLYSRHCNWITMEGSRELDDRKVKMMMRHTSDEFALGVFLLGFIMQGIALVDLSKIRKEMIVVREYDGKRYYVIETARSKTGVGVTIVLPVDDEKTEFLFKPFYDYIDMNGGFLLPVLKDIDIMDEAKVNNRMIYFSFIVNSGLKRIVDCINEERLEKDKDSVLFPKITYYSCRHTFATSFIKNGGNLFSLASMMGRSIEHIGTYIKELNGIEEFISAKKDVFG